MATMVEELEEHVILIAGGELSIKGGVKWRLWRAVVVLTEVVVRRVVELEVDDMMIGGEENGS